MAPHGYRSFTPPCYTQCFARFAYLWVNQKSLKWPGQSAHCTQKFDIALYKIVNCIWNCESVVRFYKPRALMIIQTADQGNLLLDKKKEDFQIGMSLTCKKCLLKARAGFLCGKPRGSVWWETLRNRTRRSKAPRISRGALRKRPSLSD